MRGRVCRGWCVLLVWSAWSARRVDAQPPYGCVYTYAGGGVGDGAPAIHALLTNPVDVAVDDQRGAVFIADDGAKRVFRVDANGTLSTFAGTGAAGWSGDGGPAVAATFMSTKAVAVHPLRGVLLIADQWAHVIRQVSLDRGNISVAIGTGVGGNSNGLAPRLSNILSPCALAVAANGDIWFSECEGHYVKLATATSVAAMAGTGSSGVSSDGVAGLSSALHSPGALFAPLYLNQACFVEVGALRVRCLSVAGVLVTLVGTTVNTTMAADGAIGGSTAIGQPTGLALDPVTGGVVWGEYTSNRIRRLTGAFNNARVTTIAGLGTSPPPLPGRPGVAAYTVALGRTAGMAYDAAGNLYIAHPGVRSVEVIRASGVMERFAGAVGGAGDGGEAARAHVSRPYGVTPPDANGVVW
jgi:hypothetical protein